MLLLSYITLNWSLAAHPRLFEAGPLTRCGNDHDQPDLSTETDLGETFPFEETREGSSRCGLPSLSGVLFPVASPSPADFGILPGETSRWPRKAPWVWAKQTDTALPGHPGALGPTPLPTSSAPMRPQSGYRGAGGGGGSRAGRRGGRAASLPALGAGPRRSRGAGSPMQIRDRHGDQSASWR